MPSAVRRVTVCASILLAWSTTPAETAPPQPTPPLDEVLVRVASYVQDFDDKLSQIIADETYEQTMAHGTRRTIQAERLYWWLGDERTWLSIRNVLSVDGEAVPGSSLTRLEQAFLAPATPQIRRDPVATDGAFVTSARMRALQDEASRFDIGVSRTTSDPTYVLQFLLAESQTHFAFRVDGHARINGVDAMTIAFTEVGRPTAISVGGHDSPSTGTVWVNERTAAVVRTELKNQKARAVIRVDFAPNSGLSAWVPRRMTEQYQNVRCQSTFTNMRRFDASAHLVSP